MEKVSLLKDLFIAYSKFSANPELIDLHLFLMRRIHLKWARADKFDMCLEKFCEFVPVLTNEMLELKRFGYVDLPISDKLAIFKALCESQFDWNYKFKETVGFSMKLLIYRFRSFTPFLMPR
jgi:hypothetical protein